MGFQGVLIEHGQQSDHQEYPEEIIPRLALKVNGIEQRKKDPYKADHAVSHQEGQILVMRPQPPFRGKGTPGPLVIFVKGGPDITGTHAKHRMLPENVQSGFQVQDPL